MDIATANNTFLMSSRVTMSTPSTSVPRIVPIPEEELATLPGAGNLFGPTHGGARDAYRLELAENLAVHLEAGCIEEDHTGPVERLVHPPQLGEVNLQLESDACVFGFCSGEGGPDGFYVSRRVEEVTEYYLISIEGGDGVSSLHDIYVSPPMDWETFKMSLPPT